MPSLKAPCVCISAFTDSALGGSLAMIVALPPGKIIDGTYDADFMRRVALNFFMSILVLISRPDSKDPNIKDDDKDVFDVRFFVGSYAPVICAHGMFAATKAIFYKLLPGLDWDPPTCIVRFRTGEETLVSSRMVPSAEPRVDSDGIDLPANTLVEVDAVEKVRITSILRDVIHRRRS